MPIAADAAGNAAAKAAPRSAARLGAVQALYQMDIAATDLADVLAEFAARRAAEDSAAGAADAAFFEDIVGGVVREQRALDPEINAHLAQGWALARLDATLRAILRAGAYELAARRDVPAKVAISEYVNVAHAFFDGEEPKVVNAVLDKIARARRGEDLG